MLKKGLTPQNSGMFILLSRAWLPAVYLQARMLDFEWAGYVLYRTTDEYCTLILCIYECIYKCIYTLHGSMIQEYVDTSHIIDNILFILSIYTLFGWWFGTFVYVSHHIGNFIIPTDFHSMIFQRGCFFQPPSSYYLGQPTG